MATHTQAATPNTMTLQSLMDFATALGTEAGKGRDTQIKFYLKLVEGAFQGTLTTDPNKHGADQDDATILAAAYVKAQTGSQVFDAKAPNQRKLISCLRTCVKLGMWPKGGPGEPLQTVNDMIAERQKLRTKPQVAAKLDDAANGFLRFARNQLKRDTLMDKAEWEQFLYKPQQSLSTAEDILANVRGTLQKLRDGKAASGTALDNSPQVVKAIQEITARLAAIAKAKAPSASSAAAHTGSP